VEKAPPSYESRKDFPERYLDEPLDSGRSSLMLHGTKMDIDVPLSQEWAVTKDSNHRPVIYELRENAFSIDFSEGSINYRVQVWVTHHGPPHMFVRDAFEHGDGFAWVGGRPESNRRKF